MPLCPTPTSQGSRLLLSSWGPGPATQTEAAAPWSWNSGRWCFSSAWQTRRLHPVWLCWSSWDKRGRWLLSGKCQPGSAQRPFLHRSSQSLKESKHTVSKQVPLLPEVGKAQAAVYISLIHPFLSLRGAPGAFETKGVFVLRKAAIFTLGSNSNYTNSSSRSL